MSIGSDNSKRTWRVKFRDAFRGIGLGVRGQNSFFVHIAATVLVCLTACLLGVTITEWCLLALCIAMVMIAELFNSALESLAKAISSKRDQRIGDGLDISSGAVLLASISATIVGLIVFVFRLGARLDWWG